MQQHLDSSKSPIISGASSSYSPGPAGSPEESSQRYDGCMKGEEGVQKEMQVPEVSTRSLVLAHLSLVTCGPRHNPATVSRPD
jgi:hypothetical protein